MSYTHPYKQYLEVNTVWNFTFSTLLIFSFVIFIILKFKLTDVFVVSFVIKFLLFSTTK